MTYVLIRVIHYLNKLLLIFSKSTSDFIKELPCWAEKSSSLTPADMIPVLWQR